MISDRELQKEALREMLSRIRGRLDSAVRIGSHCTTSGRRREAVPILGRKPALDAAEHHPRPERAGGGQEVPRPWVGRSATTEPARLYDRRDGLPPIHRTSATCAAAPMGRERSRGWTRSRGAATARSFSTCGGRAGEAAVPALAALSARAPRTTWSTRKRTTPSTWRSTARDQRTSSS